MGYSRVAPELSMDDVLRERLLAILVDAAIVAAGTALVVAVAAVALGVGVGAAAGHPVVLATVPAGWLVYAVALQGRYGQTVGKAVAGIVVVSKDGSPCDYRAAALRELVRAADFALAPLIGVMFVFRSRRRQRLGDVVAETIVVRARSGASI